ncbi:MAG TPA: hypothetical protein VF510_17120 [Ktedonobacterales bacterium]
MRSGIAEVRRKSYPVLEYPLDKIENVFYNTWGKYCASNTGKLPFSWSHSTGKDSPMPSHHYRVHLTSNQTHMSGKNQSGNKIGKTGKNLKSSSQPSKQHTLASPQSARADFAASSANCLAGTGRGFNRPLPAGHISGNISGNNFGNIGSRHNTVHSHPFRNSSGNATNAKHSGNDFGNSGKNFGNISGNNFGNIGKADQPSPYNTTPDHTRRSTTGAAAKTKSRQKRQWHSHASPLHDSHLQPVRQHRQEFRQQFRQCFRRYQPDARRQRCAAIQPIV